MIRLRGPRMAWRLAAGSALAARLALFAIPGAVYALESSAGGTEVTLEIPLQAETGNVLVWRPGNKLSNPLPIVVEPVGLWDDLGGGTAGVAGEPTLTMSGSLGPSSFVTLDLGNGAPSALALAFLSFGSAPAYFLGGRLHFFPGALSGTQLWFQVGIDDPAVPIFSASLSNAVRGTVP